jgi:hypothetical protein
MSPRFPSSADLPPGARAKTELLLHFFAFASLRLLGVRETCRAIGGLTGVFFGDHWKRQLERLREEALLEVSPGGAPVTFR